MITTDFVTVEDHVMVSVLSHVHRKRRTWSLVGAILGVGLFVSGFFLQSEINVVGGLVAAGAFAYDSQIAIPKRWQRAHSKDSTGGRKVRAVITADSVSFEAENGVQTTVPWSEFVKIEEFGGDYLLYTGTTSVMPVFKCFQTDEQWSQFKLWAEANKARLASHA